MYVQSYICEQDEDVLSYTALTGRAGIFLYELYISESHIHSALCRLFGRMQFVGFLTWWFCYLCIRDGCVIITGRGVLPSGI